MDLRPIVITVKEWNMIKAVGAINGKTIVAIYEDGEFTFNGEKNIELEVKAKYHISKCHPIGGTYYPAKNDAINIYNVFENWLFDKLIRISEKDEPIEEMPFEKGVLY